MRARERAHVTLFPVTLVTVSNPGYSLVLYVQRLRSLLRFEAGRLQSFSVLASFNNGNLDATASWFLLAIWRRLWAQFQRTFWTVCSG